MIAFFMRSPCEDTDTDTYGEMPRMTEARISDVAASQGMLWLTNNHQKLEEARKSLWKEHGTADPLVLDFKPTEL